MKKRVDTFIEIKSIVDIEGIAASLASCDAEEQGEFFSVFFNAIKINCEDNYRFLMQLTYISHEINKNEKISKIVNEAFNHLSGE